MDIRIEKEPPSIEQPLQQIQQSILENNEPEKQQKTPAKKKTSAQKAIRKTFKTTASLANLLPTGTLFIFQFLSPILTNNGQCQNNNPYGQILTLLLLTFCGASCFVMSFTDSFLDESSDKVRYGLATFKGLWVIDGSVTLPDEKSAKYKIRPRDFIHAILSVLVFVAVAMFDQNVIKCFVPKQSEETKEKLLQVPIGIGAVCSFLFAKLPSKRHGVGFPLSRAKSFSKE